jgi:hypothetical protein
MDTPVNGAHHQPSVLQHADVPGDGRQRHSERLGQLGDHVRAFREAREQSATGAVTKRLEDDIETVVKRWLVDLAGERGHLTILNRNV